jgi:ubiquinone/menaquinone biosynthesis C-methylase UbiE
MDVEKTVSRHYTHGALEQTILDGLRKAGKDPDKLGPDDLSPVDEFHIGGAQATSDFAARLGFTPGMHLLDVGCGIGGPSRFFARAGCRVTGIDLTEEFVRTAESLTRRVGLGDKAAYKQGSALALPFAAGTFDGAYMLHVGMNIQDKASLAKAVRGVLKTGAVFGVYDVMREEAGELSFPVPWAETKETSFVEDAATYRRVLENAGFTVVEQRSRREFAIAFFREMQERAAQEGGPPALGLHLLFGEGARAKAANMVDNLKRGLIAPTEMIGKAV